MFGFIEGTNFHTKNQQPTNYIEIRKDQFYPIFETFVAQNFGRGNRYSWHVILKIPFPITLILSVLISISFHKHEVVELN